AERGVEDLDSVHRRSPLRPRRDHPPAAPETKTPRGVGPARGAFPGGLGSSPYTPPRAAGGQLSSSASRRSEEMQRIEPQRLPVASGLVKPRRTRARPARPPAARGAP